ncbi:diguanylate cyclase [Candidatus Neomarinimicrobiota bacterium]
MPQLSDKGELDHFTDSLWIAFTILERSMIDSNSAVYLREGLKDNFMLHEKSRGDISFSKIIPTSVVSKYFAEIDDPSNRSAQPLDATPFTEDSTESKIRLHTLYTEDKIRGLLVVALQQEDKQADEIIELAAQIIQNNLAMESQFNLINAENAFLSDLVSRAGSFDLSSTSEAVINTLVGLTKSILTFDRLTISIQSTEVKEGLRIEWVEGESKGYAAGYEFDSAQVLHGEVYRQGESIHIGYMQESDYQGRFVKGDFRKSKLRSFMGVPIIESGIAKGTVAVESLAQDQYNDKDLQLLKSIVQVYGTAICWLQRYQEAHAMATVDGLTQLLNHRSFMERFSEEVERAARYGGAITYLMIDLDHFKQVNDTYGHLHGDYVLWQTSQLIRACIRKADIAGRYGGEEFGVIIINAGKQESFTTADRIRQTIADYKFKNNGVENRISASIGMAEYPMDGHDVNTLILRADQAMYTVKHRGGNDVLSYSADLKTSKMNKE